MTIFIPELSLDGQEGYLSRTIYSSKEEAYDDLDAIAERAFEARPGIEKVCIVDFQEFEIE